MKKLRLAAVQAAPVFLNREASIAKACDLIREAGRNGADVIGFPEGFVPTHPGWFNYLPVVGDKALLLSRELFKNSVEVPSPATDALCRACRDAGVVAVVGINEKMPDTTGTMYNTQLFIDRTGELLGKHQKLMPTNGERQVHTGGSGHTLTAFKTHFGNVSGLLCGENSNPLAAFILGAQYPVVHVAGWPAHFNSGRDRHVMQEQILIATRGLAYSLKVFVINAVAVVTDELVKTYGLTEEDRAELREMQELGGASIIDPRGKIIAGPMEKGEGILYADVDLESVIIPKMIHDVGGHYNRPDLYSVLIREQDNRLLRSHAADWGDEPHAPGGRRAPGQIGGSAGYLTDRASDSRGSCGEER